MNEIHTIRLKLTENPRNKRWKWTCIVTLDEMAHRSVSQTNIYGRVLSRHLAAWCFEQGGLPARALNTVGTWRYEHMMYCEPFVSFCDPALAAAFKLRWHGVTMDFREEYERMNEGKKKKRWV